VLFSEAMMEVASHASARALSPTNNSAQQWLPGRLYLFKTRG
jgi:hypothetical protein